MSQLIINKSLKIFSRVLLPCWNVIIESKNALYAQPRTQGICSWGAKYFAPQEQIPWVRGCYTP